MVPSLHLQTRRVRRSPFSAGWWTAVILVLVAPAGASAQAPASTVSTPPVGADGRSQAPVIVSGTVPDEATRQAILNRAREVYGANRVVDQLGVGDVVAPANWSQYVQQIMAAPPVRNVGKGRLSIRGSNVDITGEVPSEAHRLQIAADVSALLNPTYLVRNGLSVATSDQSLLDATLANRIIEFEPSSSTLRTDSQTILNEMAQAMKQLGGKRVSVVGHTDASGDRATNILLSQARAEAVRTYLTRVGIPAGSINTTGVGPDQPIASNATPDGRARNRRIEFRLVR